MHRGVGFVPETGSRLRDVLHCFSALSNGRKLLSLSGGSDSSSDNLSCLNGIRFVTTFWLICVHTLIRVVGMAKSNVANPKLVEQVTFPNAFWCCCKVLIDYRTVLSNRPIRMHDRMQWIGKNKFSSILPFRSTLSSWWAVCSFRTSFCANWTAPRAGYVSGCSTCIATSGDLFIAIIKCCNW